MKDARADPSPSGASVDIDLDALLANYRLLAAAASGAEAGAVVKCGAYGLGLAPVARSLAGAGCRTFFASSAEEGAALRRALGRGAAVLVLNGPDTNNLPLFAANALTPVLNTLAQAALWSRDGAGPTALHIETGMNRLGAPAEDLEAIAALPLDVSLVISHLACSSEPAHEMNERQRRAFERAAARFPGARRSLAASAGTLMGVDYHYDLIRPGAALYGVSPFDFPEPRLRPVATLTAPVLQIRRVGAGDSVGYGATKRFDKDARLATVALGYGDGFPRNASGRAQAWLGGALCPVAGRVSMDFITLDITEAPQAIEIGNRAEFFGPAISIDEAAAASDTIGYEMLTRLGARLARRYFFNGALIGA